MFSRWPSLAIQPFTMALGVASALLPQARFSPVAQVPRRSDVGGKAVGDRLPAGRDVAEEALPSPSSARSSPRRSRARGSADSGSSPRAARSLLSRHSVAAFAVGTEASAGRRLAPAQSDACAVEAESVSDAMSAVARSGRVTGRCRTRLPWARREPDRAGGTLGSSHAAFIDPQERPDQNWTVPWTPVRHLSDARLDAFSTLSGPSARRTAEAWARRGRTNGQVAAPSAPRARVAAGTGARPTETVSRDRDAR